MRWSVIVTLVTLVGVSHGAQVPDDIAAGLSAPEKAERLEALLRVQRMKRATDALLVPVAERLLDPAPEVRVEAAYAVYRVAVLLGCKPGAVGECAHFRGLPLTPPVLETRVAPRYPENAVASRIQGVVVLECLVGEDGSVSRVFANTGPPQLHKAAEETLLRWRYTPGRFKGQAVPFAMLVTVTFSLERR